MYAVVRETTYPTDKPLAERPEFKAFQDVHAAVDGLASMPGGAVERDGALDDVGARRMLGEGACRSCRCPSRR